MKKIIFKDYLIFFRDKSGAGMDESPLSQIS